MVKKQWDFTENRATRVAYNEAMTAKKDSTKLTDEQQGAIAAWQERESNNKPDTANTNRNERKMRSDYFTIFSYFIPQNADGEVWYMYNEAWDMLSMMLFGMAMYLWGFFSNKLRTSTYIMWMLIGYGIGIPIAWVLFDKGWMDAAGGRVVLDSWRSSPRVFEEFRRIPLTIGHASLMMLIFRSGVAMADESTCQCGADGFHQLPHAKHHLHFLLFHGYGLGIIIN